MTYDKDRASTPKRDRESTEKKDRESTEMEEPRATERELALRLLASHALADPKFFQRLRRDPQAAAASLSLHLSDGDVAYIRDQVDWNALDAVAGDVRGALKVGFANSSW